jgi:hypothetical protein
MTVLRIWHHQPDLLADLALSPAELTRLDAA